LTYSNIGVDIDNDIMTEIRQYLTYIRNEYFDNIGTDEINFEDTTNISDDTLTPIIHKGITFDNV
jgi:ribonucleotide reductase beta subunit family protein with ferritin-like domain